MLKGNRQPFLVSSKGQSDTRKRQNRIRHACVGDRCAVANNVAQPRIHLGRRRRLGGGAGRFRVSLCSAAVVLQVGLRQQRVRPQGFTEVRQLQPDRGTLTGKQTGYIQQCLAVFGEQLTAALLRGTTATKKKFRVLRAGRRGRSTERLDNSREQHVRHVQSSQKQINKAAQRRFDLDAVGSATLLLAARCSQWRGLEGGKAMRAAARRGRGVLLRITRMMMMVGMGKRKLGVVLRRRRSSWRSIGRLSTTPCITVAMVVVVDGGGRGGEVAGGRQDCEAPTTSTGGKGKRSVRADRGRGRDPRGGRLRCWRTASSRSSCCCCCCCLVRSCSCSGRRVADF